jgi:hypothetical protein
VGLEPVVEEVEVVPDFAGLIVAAVGFAFEDGYVGLRENRRVSPVYLAGESLMK